MERVLSCPELIELILEDECIDADMLTRCMRVRRCWFDVGARMLWWDLEDVDILFQLLPPVTLGEYGMLLYETLSEANWIRFDLYAKFVRRLDLSSEDGNMAEIHQTLSQLAYRHSTKCLLPNITELQVSALDMEDILDCLFFIRDDLQMLSVEGLDDPLDVYNLLRCILPRTPNITTLTISLAKEMDPRPFDEDLSLALKKLIFLEELYVDVFNLSSNTLLHLAALPRLTTIGHSAKEQQSFSSIETKESTGDFQLSMKGIDRPFSLLRDITLELSISTFMHFLSIMTEVLQIDTFFVTILDDASEASLRWCCERLTTEWSNLTCLQLYLAGDARERLHHFSALRGLLKLKNLKMFRFFSLHPLLIGDGELESAICAWPLLRIFAIYSIPNEDRPTLTLAALASVAKYCKHIEFLAFTVDATHITPIHPETASAKKLKSVDFGYSPILDSANVAKYICELFSQDLHFPSEDSQFGSTHSVTLKKYKRKWDRVSKLLQPLSSAGKRGNIEVS